jgi:acetyl esterase/lipase
MVVCRHPILALLPAALLLVFACASPTLEDPGAEAQELASVAVPLSAPSPLVIGEIYGGGGNLGAPFRNDYIEIFNRGAVAIDLTGLSVQYASAQGTDLFGSNSNKVTVLPSASLAPGATFLVQEASGGASGAALPSPSLVDPSPIALAAQAGRVALVRGATPLGCNGASTPCASDATARILDLVGYGAARFFEGSAPTAAPATARAAQRAGGGCRDTDDNRADFAVATPSPRVGAGVACAPLRPFRLTCPAAGCVAARGVALVLHGGGWQDNGALPSDGLTTQAEARWTARGWASVAISYRSSAQGPVTDALRTVTAFFGGPNAMVPVAQPGSALRSIDDSAGFYARRAEAIGAALARKPTCVVGFSAGGHLALLVAVRHPDVACVVADAAPANLVDMPLPPGAPDPLRLQWLAGVYAEFAFGPASAGIQNSYKRPELSPTKLAQTGGFPSGVPVLLGYTQDDPFVGPGHAEGFAAARPSTLLFELTPSAVMGAPGFVHSPVTPESLADYRAVEDALAHDVGLP